MNQSNEESKPPSILIAFCLLIAVTACSSAGVVFDALTSVKGVPPFLAAFWRLFLQTIIQSFPFLLSIVDVFRQDRRRIQEGGNENENAYPPCTLPKYVASFPLMCISGFFLGLHFSLWVYSLRFTSITHSLLWVASSPIVLNVGAWIGYFWGKSKCYGSLSPIPKPSGFETWGALVGMLGAVVMLFDIRPSHVHAGEGESEGINQSIHPPSIYGDIAAFGGAVAVCVYLLIGQHLRSWMPIWLYVYPVTAFACISCMIFALWDPEDPAEWNGTSRKSILGCFSREYLAYACYLAIGPGIFGHTMLNTLVKYVSPLLITMALLCEPIIGSIIGHIVGLQPLPGAFTLLGGGILLVGLILVVIGESIESKETNTMEQNKISQADGNDYGTIPNEETDV